MKKIEGYRRLPYYEFTDYTSPFGDRYHRIADKFDDFDLPGEASLDSAHIKTRSGVEPARQQHVGYERQIFQPALWN